MAADPATVEEAVQKVNLQAGLGAYEQHVTKSLSDGLLYDAGWAM